jgi:Tfp pilus assembly protein PilV
VKSSRGLTILEAIVALAIFSTVVLILTSLQAEFTQYDRENVVRSASTNAANNIITRLRRDVVEASAYPSEFQGYEQSDMTLVLRSTGKDGSVRHVVWDFREASVARRREFSAAGESDWYSSGAPRFLIGATTLADGTVAVRVTATSEGGRLLVDRVVAPRAN